MTPSIPKFMRTTALFAAIAAGCTGGQSGNEGASSPQGHAEGTEFTSIASDGRGTSALLNLCQLVRHPMFEAGGLYGVKSLTGVTEEDLWDPGVQIGFTYVELSLADRWFGAGENAVARIVGGPYPSGDVGGWQVTLRVGDVVGLLLVDRTPENRGYYGLHELGTFNAGPDGGYSNGQLFTARRVEAKELGDLISGLAGSGLDAACPYNEFPVDGVQGAPIVDPDNDGASVDVRDTPEEAGDAGLDGSVPDEHDAPMP